MKSKWAVQFYGFVEADTIYDSTQSLADSGGNALISHNATFAGQNGRFQLGIRNSRFGFAVDTPNFGSLKVSGKAEIDFLGNQPADASEAAVWNNPAMRARHLYVKLENPFVDVLFGQTWNLFGAQPLAQPASVQIQGLPGQLYSRGAQIRLSKTLRTEPLTVEIAVAAARAPQKDVGIPDLQGAVKVQLTGWRGVHTNSATGTAVDPLTLSISGIYRSFELSTDATPSTALVKKTNGWGVSVDALLPVIRGSQSDRSNALALTASYALGAGIGDMYSGLATGVAGPAASAGNTAFAIDKNLATLDKSGAAVAVQLSSMFFGVQYYFPGGDFWFASNFASLASDNAKDLANPASALKRAIFYDACLFWDVHPAVRVGAEYARTTTTYGDGATATNDRGQLSVFYVF